MNVINYDEWELFSARRNSTNYRSFDQSKVLKVSGPDLTYDLDVLEHEKAITEAVVSLGIKTPRVLEIVKDPKGTYGIIYENVKDKLSISRALSQDLEGIDKYVKMFADAVKKLHTTKCTSPIFTKYRDFAKDFISKSERYTEKQRSYLLRLIDQTEDVEMCMHGDCHPGNFIYSKDNVYAIDLAFFAKGHPLFDLGAFYCFAVKMPDDVIKGVFHVEPKVMKEFWDKFIPLYLDTNDEKVINDFNRKIESYGFIGLAKHASHLPDPYVYFDMLNRDFDEAFKWMDE